jgi:hypothetical protein
MWKFVFNVANVIFELGIFKRKTHKVRRNIAHLKLEKNMFLEQFFWKENKLQFIWTYENIVKF